MGKFVSTGMKRAAKAKSRQAHSIESNITACLGMRFQVIVLKTVYVAKVGIKKVIYKFFVKIIY